VTHLVDFQTKNALRIAVNRGMNVKFEGKNLDKTITIEQLRVGEQVFCTNSRRNWFARVYRTQGGIWIE